MIRVRTRTMNLSSRMVCAPILVARFIRVRRKGGSVQTLLHVVQLRENGTQMNLHLECLHGAR